MLKTITLKNFQKHKLIKLNLEQINCISGPSNHGKSSVLRALRWLCLNQPRGDDWCIRWGSKSVSVEAEVDGHTIIRGRDGSNNYYKLDDKEFHAFGATVPEPIAKLLNLDDVNFAGQLEPHYWFHLTPGECAKELNRIVSLDRIDEVTASIASALRKVKSEAEVSEKRLAEARAKRDETAWVVEADGELKEVETKYNELDKIVQDASGLAGLVEAIGTVKEESRNALEGTQDVRMTIEKAKEWFDLGLQREGLEKVLQNTTLAREEWGSVGDRLAAVQTELAEVKSCPLCGSLFDSKTAKRHMLCAK